MTEISSEGVLQRFSDIEKKSVAVVAAVVTDVEKGSEMAIKAILTAEQDVAAWKANNPVLAALAADLVQVVLAGLQARGMPVAVAEGAAAEILSGVSAVATKAVIHAAS